MDIFVLRVKPDLLDRKNLIQAGMRTESRRIGGKEEPTGTVTAAVSATTLP